EHTSHELHFIRIQDLFEIHSQSFNDFIYNVDNKEAVLEALTQYLSEEIETIILDNVDEYEFESKIEYRQVGPQDYTEDIVGYELEEDIRDIIDGVFDDYFEELDPLIKRWDIGRFDLYFDENDLIDRMETLYMEQQISSAESYYDDRPRG